MLSDPARPHCHEEVETCIDTDRGEPHTQEKLVRDVLNITSPARSNLSHTRGVGVVLHHVPATVSITSTRRAKHGGNGQSEHRHVDDVRPCVCDSAHVQLCCKSRAVGTHYNVLLF